MDKNKSHYSHIAVSKDEVDYLSHKYEVRDHADLFSWGVKLLYDLSKLEENGWYLTLQKMTIDSEGIKLEKYRSIYFKVEYLAPRDNKFPRLPLAETLNKNFKID